MKKSLFTLLTACAALAFVVSAGHAEDDKPKKKKEVTTTTCPVAGKEIKIADAKTVAYKDAKVYVCCDKCKAKMEEDAKPFAVKANQQLVQTRQYRQTKCPLSGGEINKEQKTKVGATMVRFCCEKCKGKVDEAKGDAQLELVFSDKAFAQGFKAAKKKSE
ncbi:MAG: hypothetical protein R3C59_23075 [Planctomycetaceae bacterium]